MLFDKKADPLRKHLVFYDTLLYNKESIPVLRGIKRTKIPRFSAAEHKSHRTAALRCF